jgi:N-acetylneuraminic acid mutarotase
MKKLISVFFLFFTIVWTLVAAPPVPFSGKLAVDGKNFHGNALFAFSIVDGEGAVHWKHATENNATIENFVLNGRYLVLLGGQGMQTLPANLFLENDNLFLRVRVDLQDGQGMRLLSPDQQITSTPYALAAELARVAEKASVADGVTPGAITAGMIDTGLLADLNRTAGITEITREMLPQDVRDDLNRTIGVAQLSAEVNEKLNRDFTIQPGSISKSLLGQDVLGDLNRTILRHHLSEELRAELNRTIRLRDLAPEVIADLNDSIAPGSITLDMLASGVRADLNRTVRLQDLSPEVWQSINRSITLSDLDSQVITELNNSIANGSITLDLLSSQVRNDLNRTITKSMLSQEVLNELNVTIGPSKLSPAVRNALKPVVIRQPSSLVAHAGVPTYLSVDVTGGDNTYQWKKDGVDIVGASSKILSIADLNASQHEGNYTVVVSNAFGSVTSSLAQIDVNASLTEGLVGWWKFDETSGNIAYDSSGNGNDGNLTNGPTWTEGKIGGALSFDGIDDHIVFGSATGLNVQHISIAAFLYSEDSINKGLIFEKKTQYLLFFESHGVLRWRTFAPSFHDLTVPVNDTSKRMPWVHLSATYDGASKKVFIDGILADSGSTSGTFNFGVSNESSIGKMMANDNYFFEQIIDDLRIYDRALSAFEVKALYELGEQPVQVSRSGTTAVVSGEVPDGSISLSKLSSEVRADLNRTITKSMLGQDVLADLNRTITKSMLSQEVLNELNSSSGGGGVVPGSLLAVPRNQSAPSGYSLFQSGEPKELVWEEKEPVSVARYAYDGVEVLGGKIYFVGGHDGTARNIAERYDPATNTWETLENMSAARHGVACAVLNGKLYAIGGAGLTSVEVFDPSNDSWSAGIALPSEVNHGTAITINGKIYLIGGSNSSNQHLNQVLCFDPSTSQWSTKTAMPTARHGHKLVWLENRIWAIGGSGSDGSGKVESYDPTTDTWQAEASLTTARDWHVAWVANGRIYVGGGYDGSSRLNSIDVYDPALKQWSSAGTLPENKFVADTVVLNDKAYVVAGQTAVGVYSNKVFAADLNASVSGVFDLYRKDGNASSGVPTVQAEVADGSIGPRKLSSEVSNALKPVVIGQPSSVVEVGGTSAYLTVGATGGDNTYQWKKDGVDIAGATSSTLSIADLNASQHEGNYTVLVSNAFGSTSSGVAQIDVNGSLTEGLVGWWKFDETDGDVAYDSSGNGNDANLTNGATWTEGKIGGAISLDGFNDRIKIPHNVLNEKVQLSISFWFIQNPNSDDKHTLLSGASSTTDNELIIAINQTNGDFEFWEKNAIKLFFASATNTNDWYIITIVRKSNTTEFYLSGDLKNSSTYTATEFNISSNGLWIGGEQDSIGGNWQTDQQAHGILDDFRIYDRALSAVEVKALYELGEQPVQESGSGTTTVVNGTVANGSITTNQLSEQILKYLKPEITNQPQAQTVFADANHTLSVSAEGKYLTYQWKKNGTALAGETNATLTITDANATQHDGNYSVVISNDFGSVESGEILVDVNTTWSTDGLVGWWKFDETSGTVAYDSSGNGNDGTLTNGPTWATGKIGGALSFDGVDDYVQIPNMQSFFSNAASFTTWVKVTDFSTSNNQGLAEFGSSSHNLHYQFHDDNTIYMNILRSSDRVNQISPITEISEWHLLSITSINGGDWVMYQNFSEAKRVLAQNLSLPSSQSFGRSRQFSTSFRYLQGLLDDIRVYDRALSANEVQALYQLGQ